MTDHLLTAADCKQIQQETHHIAHGSWEYGEDSELLDDLIRAGYDKGREDGREDRLDEVIEWLRATRYYGRVADLADQLEEAMRPQQQQEDNW